MKNTSNVVGMYIHLIITTSYSINILVVKNNDAGVQVHACFGIYTYLLM